MDSSPSNDTREELNYRRFVIEMLVFARRRSLSTTIEQIHTLPVDPFKAARLGKNKIADQLASAARCIGFVLAFLY